MKIRKLFPLLFVAVAATVLAPERASAQCECVPKEIGFCHLPGTTAETAVYEKELSETLAAIRANRSISADGRFFFARRGADFVVRRKCDIAEVGRVAIADVEAVPVVGAG